jgi:hypothetical protein
MIIYNKEWLDNLNVRQASALWLKKRFIQGEEEKVVIARYATEYKPQGFFGRIGMFIFGTIILISSYWLVFIFTDIRGEAGWATESVILGIIAYILAEYFVKARNHFRSGILDSMLYASLIGFGIGVCILIDRSIAYETFDPLIDYFALAPFVIMAAIRFADAFLALIAYSIILIINILLLLKLGTFGKIILPFECMAFSFMVYYWVKKQQPKTNLRYWSNCLWVIELASLLTLYMAGNYLVVRKLNESLLDTQLTDGEDIHFAFFFYAYTILVPLAYIWLGLKRKDRLFIRIGVLLVAAGVLSIRYYHSFMPIETALLLSGGALIAVAWLSIRYLKVPRNGITSKADEDISKLDTISNIAFVELAVQNQAAPPLYNPAEPGGGQFGGGGAGADF